MAQQFSKTDQKRISFLSVFATLEGDYDQSLQVIEQMESDGFFDQGNSSSRSSGRSGRSSGRASSSRSSNRGRSGGFDGKMKDPDGPPTDAQVRKVLSLTDDYGEDELYDMSKQDVSNLIQDLLD